jgi:hypothetical protein
VELPKTAVAIVCHAIGRAAQTRRHSRSIFDPNDSAD